MKKHNLILLLSIALTSQFASAQNYFAGTSAGAGATGSNLVGVGTQSQSSGSSGIANTSIGFQSLKALQGGWFNSAIGNNALGGVTSGNANTGLGTGAGGGVTTGNYNVAVGSAALVTGNVSNCTAVGTDALYNTTGSNNDAFGYYSLYNNTTGQYNASVGGQAQYSNKTGSFNTALGYQALYSNVQSQSTAVGYQALYKTTGNGGVNDAFGSQALYNTTTGYSNVAMGLDALYSNVGGFENAALGWGALSNSISDNYTTSVGSQSLIYQTAGGSNTAVGFQSGILSPVVNNTSYTNNTFIGYKAGSNGFNYSNSTALGSNAVISGSNTIQLGNSAIAHVYSYGSTVITSDARVKKDVQQNVPGLSFIKTLRPVTYHYDMHKMDEMVYGPGAAAYEKEMAAGIEAKSKIVYSGFLAQEVEASAKKLNYDFSGVKTPQNDKDMYGLSYSDFVVPLVKGMQEQQTMIEDQKATIAHQQDALQVLMAKVDVMSSQLNDIRDCCSYNAGQGNNITVPAAGPQLFNAVPNPASNVTTIYYSLPVTYSSASIQLSNMEGQILQTVAVRGTGSSSAEIQLGGLSSSNYYYSLIVDGRTIDTKKVSVISK